MQNPGVSENRVIGIISGGWCGPEVIEAAISVLQVVGETSNTGFDLLYFEYDNWRDTETNPQKFCDCVREFYQEIETANGAILRGSLHAPIVYRLREDFQQLYKLVPLSYLPELSDTCLVRKDIAEKIDFLLVRENCHGPYHAKYTSEQTSQTEYRLFGNFYYDERDLDRFSEIAFSLANKRSKKLHLFMKYEALGELGELWLKCFERVHSRFPEVRFTALPMGSGAAEIFYKPQEFDVIATPDVEGDILADSLARLLYGSTMLTPSGNFSPNGFASYQTLHGTVKPLAGKDRINPIGMIQALAMCLELSFGMEKEAHFIRSAVKRTVAEGYRTIDIYRQGEHELVGTQEMTRQIIRNLRTWYSIEHSGSLSSETGG